MRRWAEKVSDAAAQLRNDVDRAASEAANKASAAVSAVRSGVAASELYQSAAQATANAGGRIAQGISSGVDSLAVAVGGETTTHTFGEGSLGLTIACDSQLPGEPKYVLGIEPGGLASMARNPALQRYHTHGLLPAACAHHCPPIECARRFRRPGPGQTPPPPPPLLPRSRPPLHAHGMCAGHTTSGLR
jgi:hypothetical protein